MGISKRKVAQTLRNDGTLFECSGYTPYTGGDWVNNGGKYNNLIPIINEE